MRLSYCFTSYSSLLWCVDPGWYVSTHRVACSHLVGWGSKLEWQKQEGEKTKTKPRSSPQWLRYGQVNKWIGEEKPQKNKWCKTSHHHQTDAQPFPQHQFLWTPNTLPSLSPLMSMLLLNMMLQSTENNFGHFGSAVPAVSSQPLAMGGKCEQEGETEKA